MTEKYKNWLVSLDSDNFTMYIKTWFAFLSSIHELILSHATPERREELMNSRGDGAFLEEYKRQYLPAIALGMSCSIVLLIRSMSGGVR